MFTDPDPTRAWRGFVAAFGRFWGLDRPVMRRLRALAALDCDVEEVIAGRDEQRRHGIEVLVARRSAGARAAAASRPGGLPAPNGSTVRKLWALTSFETFDALAAPHQPLEEVVGPAVEMTEAILGPVAPRPGGR